MPTKCCWLTGASLEEIEAEKRSKARFHYMDNSSEIQSKTDNWGKYFSKTACGLETRLPGNERSDLSLCFHRGADIDRADLCPACKEAVSSGRVKARE